MNKFEMLKAVKSKYKLSNTYTIMGVTARLLSKECPILLRKDAYVKEMENFFACSRLTGYGKDSISAPGITGIIGSNLLKSIEFMKANQ